MLTGKMIRVRHARNRLVPVFIDVDDRQWRAVAERLLDLYRGFQGYSRAELEEEIAEAVGDNPSQLVHQGLAKLLEDRCEFDVASSHPPDELRERVFKAAAVQRAAGAFDRTAILAEASREFGISVEQLDQGLFADLKQEQRLIGFQDCTVEQLLQRYNVALAQAILLRSTGVTINIHGETPSRYRQLFRAIKFHRLICDIQSAADDSFTLKLDGPLSMFSSTQKYGLQLANFLPSLLLCKRFDLKAAIRWGAERKIKEFTLDSSQGLRSHTTDHGDYVPKELTMFAEMFARQIADWDIAMETAVVAVGNGFWTPDFVLTHKASAQRVYLEILGFWRRTDVDKHCQRLKRELKEPFVVAVSEQFNIDETASERGADFIYQFKRTPLPEEVVRLARQMIGLKD
jgi:uncharacterized protein